MPLIKYNLFQGIDENCNAVLLGVSVGYNETNLAIAQREAYNGEYTIEDSKQPELIGEPTQLDRIEAQVTYTAMITDTLLEV